MSKFLSRKWLTAMIGMILDMLILSGIIPAEVKPLALACVNSIAAIYIAVEGIIDFVREKYKK